MKKCTLCIIAALLVVGSASAQDTISLYGDIGNGPERFVHVTTGVPFDIVAVAQTGHSYEEWEFVISELAHLIPEIFKIFVIRVDGSPTNPISDYGSNQRGEYYFKSICRESGVVEVVRIQYLDIRGLIGRDFVLSMRGFGPGDSLPSRFGGEMGYFDCAGVGHVLTGEPWSEYGMPDTDELAGACVLNPTWLPIPNEAASMSLMKSRF